MLTRIAGRYYKQQNSRELISETDKTWQNMKTFKGKRRRKIQIFWLRPLIGYPQSRNKNMQVHMSMEKDNEKNLKRKTEIDEVFS